MVATEAIAAAIRSLVDAVNSGNFEEAHSTFSDAPVIVEDISPYCWKGAGAPSGWLDAMGANAARLGVDRVLMTLKEPTRIEVATDTAYALVPGQLTLAAAGTQLLSDGMLTFTLLLADNRWVIDTLVWSGPSPSLVETSAMGG